MNRKALVGGGAVVLLLLASVAVGRWERSRSIHARNAGIAAVRRAIGPALYSSRLSGYREAQPVDCLTYQDGGNTFRWELCFAVDGRLIEAIDRAQEPARIWSLREEPSAATISVPPRQLYAVFRRIGAFARTTFDGVLPTAYEAAAHPNMRATLAVAAEVGPRIRRVTGYSFLRREVCLMIRRRYELCFDRRGHVLRADDSSFGLHETTTATSSPITARVSRLRAILERIGALPANAPESDLLQLGMPTDGFVAVRHHR